MILNTCSCAHLPSVFFSVILHFQSCCEQPEPCHRSRPWTWIITLSFLYCIFLPPLSKIRCPWVCGFISGLSILFHWSIFLSLCWYHTVLMTVACTIVWSQAGWFLQFHSCFSRLLWLFKVFLCFHTNCEIICSSSVKNTVGSLIGIALNL